MEGPDAPGKGARPDEVRPMERTMRQHHRALLSLAAAGLLALTTCGPTEDQEADGAKGQAAEQQAPE